MSVAKIAEKAGVSIAAVSRVLNNHPRVRPETVRQVQMALAEMGYVRPTIRRGPRFGRRGGRRVTSVAVLSIRRGNQTRFSASVFGPVLAGTVRAARELEVQILVDEVMCSDDVSAVLKDRQVDGVLVILPASIDAQTALEQLHQHLPVVRVMGEFSGSAEVDQVGPDNVAVGSLACEHLLRKGCRELAYLSGEPCWDVSRSRAAGFLAAAHRAGIVPTCYICSDDPFDCSSYGAQVVRCQTCDALAAHLASATPRPDGLFTSRDADAVRFYPPLRERGVHPGRDAVVISCDNDDARLSMLDHRPPSIDLNTEEIGRLALLRLHGRIRNPEEPTFRTLVAPRLIDPCFT